jgi:hypothetical protein
MFLLMFFSLKTAQLMLDKHDHIVEGYNTAVIRIHFDKKC